MISQRAEMKELCIILALACTFAASTPVATQAKPPKRVPGAGFRDCRACPEMVVIPAGRFAMGSSVTRERNPDDYRDAIMGFRVARALP